VATSEVLRETQLAVRDVARSVFAREATLADARRAEPLGFDDRLWRSLRDVGVPALGLTSSGVGLGDLVMLAEESGRSIASAPVIEHVVAVRAIEKLTGSVSDDIADGAAIATLALHASHASTWRLVPAGAVAQVVLGVHEGSTVVVRNSPPFVAPRNHASSPLADRRVDGSTTTIGNAGDLARALTEWQLLTAAALVGMSTTALDLAVDYVSERQQFGAPIGSFQAVQHALADLPGLIDGARLAVHEAAWALDTGRAAHSTIDLADDDIDDGATLASMAFLFAVDTAWTATDRCLHVHGGYGFAEEYDIQLLYRRARGWPLVAGDLGSHYRRLADRLLGHRDPGGDGR
jgi:alkylation response protein AidB-like acyl-CoA dehydrogenase